ncbi:hypothetical protein L204_105260 [Cryptococcus depauperatus]
MTSLQIGSSDGSHGLTQHGPSQSHLPAPSTFSQTRKWRRVAESSPSAIRIGSETPRRLSVAYPDWRTMVQIRFLLLCRFYSIGCRLQIIMTLWGARVAPSRRMDTRGHRHISKNEDAPLLGRLRYTKQNNTPSFGLNQGQRLERWDWKRTGTIHHQSRTSQSSCRCGEGCHGQHTNDSPSVGSLILSSVIETVVLSRFVPLSASAGPFGFTQTIPSLSPSIQSPPTSLPTAQAGSSQCYDSTHIRRTVRLETHSISDRHNGRSTGDAESILSQATQDFLNSEAEWRNRKDQHMRETGQYRQEKLTLVREEKETLVF